MKGANPSWRQHDAGRNPATVPIVAGSVSFGIQWNAVTDLF